MLQFNPEEVIARIKLLAKQNGESVNQALTACGFKDFVVNLRKGSMPSVDKFFTLANHFSVSLSDLLLGGPEADSVLSEATPEDLKVFRNYMQLGIIDRAKISERILFMLESAAPLVPVAALAPHAQQKAGATRKMRIFDDTVSAGLGNYLSADSSDHGESLDFPEAEVPTNADFGIRISGDSMLPKIADGQIVWVKQQESVGSGQIGIFIVNGDAYCKQLKIDADNASGALVSLNVRYAPIKIAESDYFKTVGRVLLPQ